ncbi:apses transcription [Moniliophthora roreri MCA 2997]|uniref:Apses transcription n=1 Tax=Moniliophthora roreri (strain MCA 2997) TaxID=1381753 RepID=V2X4Q3_MONRO|nr:apses transcription [Moniliophthora roreri MCA 2997]
MPRPPLPLKHANPKVKTIRNIPPVKYQVLNCQGNDILVGRLKIDTPTVTGHAFILRRYDTNAISLTTMFRAAFPNASEQEEKDEVQWVKEAYDLSGNNGSSKDTSITRLAGTWVSPELALELGRSYQLGDLIDCVVQAQPDPNVSYRRSGKNSGNQASTPKAPINATTSSEAVATAESPSSTRASATANTSPDMKPPKRRREASPAPVTATVTKTKSVTTVVEEKPPPRRSTRTKSPPPKTTPSASLMSVVSKTTTSSPGKTPSKRTTRRTAKQEEPTPVTPGGSDETAYEDEREREDGSQAVEDAAGAELHDQDIAEQKDLIEGLKKQRDAAMKNEDGEVDGTAALKTKRAREDEEDKQLTFNFKEPEVGERAIATNRRVLGRILEEPRRRSLAWGIAAFAFGYTAVTFLPGLL